MHFLLFYLKVSALQLKTALQNGKLASEKCLDDGQPANKFSWRRSEVGGGGGGGVLFGSLGHLWLGNARTVSNVLPERSEKKYLVFASDI